MTVLRKTGVEEQASSAGGDALIAHGQSLYDERLKATLESEHAGRFVAIEPTSGRFFLGDTGTAALIAARDAMPNSQFYLVRVGRDAAHTIGGHGKRVR